MKIGMMDRTLALHVSGQVMAMAMARQPKSESPLQDKEAFRNVQGSSGAFCCGEKDGLSVSKYSRRVHELEVWRLQFRSRRSSSCSDDKYVGGARRKALAFCSVLNEMDQNSTQGPRGPASPDVLKDQLESLQDEASQVHNRHNNARARFMRLTEVAQQLRRRAAIDLKLGNEDGARKALIEKQKVIQAAELSKRRAQLLEELSTKLGEAISAKETQYIVALSTLPREERTVRVVSPKGEGSSSVELDLDEEGNPSGPGPSETSRLCHEATDSVNLAAATEDMNGVSRQVLSVSGDGLLQREKLSLDAKLGYSADRLINGNDEDLEAEDVQAAVPVHYSYNTNVALERDEIVGDDKDIDVQSGGSLVPKTSLQGESLATGTNGGVKESILDIGIAHSFSDISDVDDLKSGSTRNGEASEPTSKFRPEYVDVRDGSEKMGTAGQDGVGQSERIECREASGKASFNDGRRLLVQRLILDVDHQVTAIELRLKTEVSRNMDSNDTELQMVGDLLEQIQSVRARISEVVVLLAQKET